MRSIGVVSVGFVVALALVAAVPAPATAAPRPYLGASLEVDISLFHDDLAPYGHWVEVENYGPAWVPHVRHGWRPYAEGHWAWTEDYGWLWVSDEPFGWAVFHYGRWYPSPRYGWVWVPGYEWAPAWVAFRIGDGYAGWAPLPPAFEWEVGVGFRVGAVDFDRYVEPRAYCFVPEREFLDPVRGHVLPVERNTALVRVTRNVTSYAGTADRIVNRSIAPEHVREVTHRAVPRVRVVDVGSAAAARRAHARRDAVPVFRPTARLAKDRIAGPEKARPNGGESRRQPEARREVAPRGEVAKELERERRMADERRVRAARELEKQRDRGRQEAQRNLARSHQRQEAERRQLEARRERADLERQHRREVKRPPRDLPIEHLARRQEEQHRALEERQIRERQQAQERREARAGKENTKRRPGERPEGRKNNAPG